MAAASQDPFLPSSGRLPLPCSFRHFSKPSQSTALQLRELLPLLFGLRARGSQAGAGVGSRFGMLNIKQAKRGVSGPEATRAALQGSRESPRVYTAGLGWGGGRGAKRRMLSAKSPHCLSRRGLGLGGMLVSRAFLLSAHWGRFPIFHHLSSRASPECFFLFLGDQNRPEPVFSKA